MKRPKHDHAERIFVVDDEEHVRLALTTTLGDCGCEVASWPSGKEVIKAAVQLNSSLIILDLGMPRISGIATLLQFLRIPTMMRTPIIIVTGNPLAHAVQSTRDLNATNFILKPWHPKYLELRVRRALGSVIAMAAA